MAIKQNKITSEAEMLLKEQMVKYHLPKKMAASKLRQEVKIEEGSFEVKKDLLYTILVTIVLIVLIVIVSRFMLG